MSYGSPRPSPSPLSHPRRVWKRNVVSALSALVAVLALAVPGSSSADTCIAAGSDLPDYGHKRIAVYIESNFAAELRASTPTSLDADLSEAQIRNLILQTMETWNMETRGFSLHFAGTGDWEENEDFCYAIPNGSYNSSLYVHFQTGGTPGSAALVKDIEDTNPHCVNHRELIIYEKTSGGANRDWRFGSAYTGSGKLLTTTLVHEWGHVVGLGHAHDVGECRAVMAYHDPGSGCEGQTWGGRHPLNWDKNCSKPQALAWYINPNGKQLQYRYQSWNSSGTKITSSVFSGPTEKNFVGGTPPRSDTTGQWYHTTFDTRYPDAYTATRSSFVNTDGNVSSLDSSSTVSSAHSDALGLDEPATLGSGEEFGYATEPLRITFLDDENDSNPNTWYNPPYIQWVRMNRTFSGSPLTSDSTLYKYAGGGYSPAYSHLPISQSWNLVTGDTVTARVSSQSFDANDGYGAIFVAPGYQSAGYLLPEGNTSQSAVKDNIPATSETNGYSYSYTTDFPAAVSCASATWGTYNCILAWLDKGAFTGEILYTYFKGLASGIEWSGAVYRRVGSYTSTAPALAYFDGAFYLAWVDPVLRRIRVHRSPSAAVWSSELDTYEPLVVGHPTFLAKHDGESVLLWTRSTN